MSLTRRGGHFWWVACDTCKEEMQVLKKWPQGAFISGRELAAEQALKKEGWTATEDNLHVGPKCQAEKVAS